MASDTDLLAEMAAFWVAFDAAGSEQERQELLRVWHLNHGGRVTNIVTDPREIAGTVLPGIHPVRV